MAHVFLPPKEGYKMKNVKASIIAFVATLMISGCATIMNEEIGRL